MGLGWIIGAKSFVGEVCGEKDCRGGPVEDEVYTSYVSGLYSRYEVCYDSEHGGSCMMGV